MTAVPWLQARQLHRLAERQGDIRGTVDDTGIRLSTAHSSATLDVLLATHHGDVNSTATVHYSDGSSASVKLAATDWASGAPTSRQAPTPSTT
ncbi:hypothetical protein GCM10018966_093170 [Streptomyces yanii]